MTFDWNAINAQGPVFWIACGSVALGMAMIAAATVAQLRRLRAAAPNAAPQRFATENIQESAPEPDPRPAVAAPVQAMGRTLAAAPAAGRLTTDTHRRRMGELLDRLESVAASLDELEPTDFPAPGPERLAAAPETPLKEHPAGVEYVFRAADG